MVYPNHKLWGLAVGAVIIEMDRGDHYWIGGREPGPKTKGWCESLLSDYYGIDSRESALNGLKYYFQQGHSAQAVDILASLDDSPETDTFQQKLVRDAAQQIEKYALTAWDMARAVMVAGRCCWAEYLSEEEAWQLIMTAAAKVQKTFPSWRMFVVNYELGRLFWSKGAAHEPTAKAIDWLLNNPQSPWNRLPFDTPLGVEIIESKDQAKSRIKKSVCPECNALKTRPSLTAYVYCDYCGSLADYDFQIARENPAAQPGPVYQQLVAQMQPTLAAAKAAGDQVAYRKAQKKLYRAWADACPQAIPPRAKEPEYRKSYISYLARACTATAFDPHAEKHQAAVEQAMAGLQWTTTDTGAYRVGSAGWQRLSDAVFAQQEYVVEFNKTNGICDRHPDRADPSIQLRIAYSLFVQGWLPMITEEQAQTLLQRTGLLGEYMAVEPLTNFHAASCVDCGAKVDIPEGARKTVCENCGRLLDAAAPTLPCPGCNVALTPTIDGTAMNCPYCQTEIRCVN